MTLPIVIESPAELRTLLREKRRLDQSIGLTPTMGALHAGHLSLVEASKQRCDFSVVTIFVNPTQFAAGEDLERYPRDLQRDQALLAEVGADVIFAPSVDTIYPTGFSTYVAPPRVAGRWEGEQRPDHFRGVATVVLKLFQLAPADWAFFGQKDYQQVQVVRAMVRDLNVPIEISMEPIVREPDGLAMSSRNAYLSESERRRAVALSDALRQVRAAAESGERRTAVLEQRMRERLATDVDCTEYAVLVDADHLEPLDALDRRWAALIAVRIGSTRLIDNTIGDPVPAA